jgi:hypothetical protein
MLEKSNRDPILNWKDLKDDLDVTIIAFLSQLPHLEVLFIGTYFAQSDYLAHLFSHAANPLPDTTVFQKLEYLRLSTDQDQYQGVEAFNSLTHSTHFHRSSTYPH